MFIVLEGADGTGKSTLVSRVANTLGGVAYATPPKKYRQYSEKLHKDASADQHYAFYKDAVVDASEEIRSLVSEGKTVVCDRYWISTLTYHQVMGVNAKMADFGEILQPDLTFLLVADPDTQIERMLVRGLDAGDKRMLDQQFELTTKLFQNLVLHAQPFIAVDTRSFSIEESTRLIAGMMA